MKKILALIVFTGSGYYSFAQCTVRSVLNKNDSICVGGITLFVGSSGSLSKIVWYNGNSIDTTVYADSANSSVVRAGDGFPGATTNQLNNPTGVFVDAIGDVYVADDNNDRILKFPPGSNSASDGLVVAGGNGRGSAANQLDEPFSVYVDASGNIYVADYNNGRVQKFPAGSNSATNGVTVAGGNGVGAAADQIGPVSICFDENGYMFVSDYENERIQKFPPGSTSATNGTTVAGGNGQGSGANQFNGCYGICFDGNGNLYVADQANSRIQEFPPGSTSATDGITAAGGNGFGAALNQLADPSVVYVDASGNIYVDDNQNSQILKFPAGSTSATNGLIIAGGTGQGTGLDQFTNSYGMYVGMHGNIYVADETNCRILEFLSKPTIDTMYVPTSPGTYTAVVTDSTGCIDTTNAIVISPTVTPGISVSANYTSVCSGDTVIFTANPFNQGSSPIYQWRVNGTDVGSNSDTLIRSSLLDGDVVSCILISSIQCALPVPSANSIAITIYQLPSVSFSPDTLIVKSGGSITLTPIISGTISIYAWTPLGGLDNTDKMDPLASPDSTTVYQLTVTNSEGCTASGKESVVIYYPLEMPSAFTPNRDGHNDVFRIPPQTRQAIQSFSVYNRWGERVFTTDNGSAGWDGTFNNQPQPIGAYVWMIKYTDPITNKLEIAKGIVTLIR